MGSIFLSSWIISKCPPSVDGKLGPNKGGWGVGRLSFRPRSGHGQRAAMGYRVEDTEAVVDLRALVAKGLKLPQLIYGR